MDSVNGGIGGRILLEANGAKIGETFAINRAPVPQEYADNTLDVFDSVRVKWRAWIGLYMFLVLGAVGDGGILVQRELGLGGFRVVVAGEEFLDIS